MFVLAALAGLAYLVARSPYVTGVGVPYDQPVAFRHKHHFTGDGSDCRCCHTSVETSSFAGMPSTKVCMNCHTQIWNGSAALEPVHQSFITGTPIAWTRVTNLPGYVYFDQSIHVQKGVGCSTCYGQVDQMPLTWSCTGARSMNWPGARSLPNWWSASSGNRRRPGRRG